VTGIALIALTAVGRVDQASRREDRRRRQYPVGIVVDQPARPWPLIRRRAVGWQGLAGPCPGLAAWSRLTRAWHARTGPAGGELTAGRRSGETVAVGRRARHELAGRDELARGRRARL
jgi:hypothetical protein